MLEVEVELKPIEVSYDSGIQTEAVFSNNLSFTVFSCFAFLLIVHDTICSTHNNDHKFVMQLFFSIELLELYNHTKAVIFFFFNLNKHVGLCL